ncbi:hypothetical protein SDC9_99199 [bioreactor metagenome]|uniref:Uncharacterized protein n=1 Tax=bioreactor metagenome TaxID=1076179 RepID=A0A645AGV8_9ZZZZ
MINVLYLKFATIVECAATSLNVYVYENVLLGILIGLPSIKISLISYTLSDLMLNVWLSPENTSISPLGVIVPPSVADALIV